MILLKNANLISCTGEAPVQGATVLIDGKYIVQVGLDIPTPKDAEVIDLDGASLLPGLTEAHAHIGGTAELSPVAMTGGDTDRYRDNLRKMLDCGITNVRTGGDFESDILHLREQVEKGEIEGPRVWAPGKVFQTEGGHPSYTVWMGTEDVIENTAFCPKDEDDVKNEINRQDKIGVNHIKMALADIDYIHPERVPEKLSPEMCRCIVDNAHRIGKKVMVHCMTPDDALTALNAGADSIEHLVCGGCDISKPFPEGLAEAFLRNSAWMVPTMAIGVCCKSGDEFTGYLSRLVGYLASRGVKFAAGTDAGTPNVECGKGLLLELQLLVKSGISPMDVLIAATKGSAELLGSNDFGTVEPGKLADLVAVKGDPVKDISQIENTLLVVKEGKIVRNFM